MLDDALTARIAAFKRRLLEGGLLQLVSCGRPSPGERDERGRRITYAYSDAGRADRSSGPRWTVRQLSTDRSDNTVLHNP